MKQGAMKPEYQGPLYKIQLPRQAGTHDSCTPTLGDPVHACITYIQATINSSWSTFSNLKDKQRHILELSTTTNAETEAPRATTELYSMVLLLICCNSRFLLLATHTTQCNCGALLHYYSSSLFTWKAVHFYNQNTWETPVPFNKKEDENKIYEINNTR